VKIRKNDEDRKRVAEQEANQKSVGVGTRHPENPYLKGKSRVIADLIIDGRSNEEIRTIWEFSRHNEEYGKIMNQMLHNIHRKLKHLGILRNKYGLLNENLPKPDIARAHNP
jgi:hypothetical protein